MDVVPLLSAFGLGAIVTAGVQAWLAQRPVLVKRSFQERKECYIGLLEAYHRAAVENTDEAAKNFAYWQMRCELVAPKRVRDAIQTIVDTNDDKAARLEAHEHLKAMLRQDLRMTR